MSKLTDRYSKDELAEKLNELVNLLIVKKDRKSKDHYCPNAIEMIRCGIGGNYGGSYYGEVIGLVHSPLVEFIADLKLES